MNSIIFLIILGLLVWFWQDSLRAREQAVSNSRRYCKKYNYQLLDETVALCSIRPGRDSDGFATWLRQYRFEFSLDGYNRYNGTANLIGYRIHSIHLEHPQGHIVESQDKNTINSNTE